MLSFPLYTEHSQLTIYDITKKKILNKFYKI